MARNAASRDVARYMGAGLTWALATLLFLWLGSVVGAWLGSRSVGALIGAFVGAAAGFYSLVRQLSAPRDTPPDGKSDDG